MNSYTKNYVVKCHFWSSYKRFGPVQTILVRQKERAVHRSMVNEALNTVNTSCIALYIGYITFVIAIIMVM